MSSCTCSGVSSGLLHGGSAGFDRAGEGHFGEATVSCNLIAAEEDAIATIDGWAITPGAAG
jgi:hypothetical protein